MCKRISKKIYKSFMLPLEVSSIINVETKGGSIMEKFIPYEKLSKKEKRKMDLAKRQTWGELNPVTRKPENSKAYNRNKARNWKRESDPIPGILLHNVLFSDILTENTREVPL